MLLTRRVVAFSGLLVALACTPPHPDPPWSFPVEEEVRHRMDAIMSESDLPALVAVAVNREGERVDYSYGNAVWSGNTPVSTSHIFRAASMTKLVTSVAALQLVERDLVGLDEDLSALMPEMTSIPVLTDEGELLEADEPITLRRLLTHTSGFGYSITDASLASFDRTNWEHDDRPRRFESGTQFRYGTSLGWAGKLVEKLSDLTLEEYFRRHITGPLGMDRTWYNLPDSLLEHVVSHGHRGDDGEQPLSEDPDRVPRDKRTTFGGGSGLFTSPDDFTLLLACLLGDGSLGEVRLLKESTIDQMFTSQLVGISMDIEDAYFDPALCCDFRGLIKPTANWGLGGLIDTEPTDYGRQAGTMLWGGAYNTYWYIDRDSGIAASIYTQHLPFNHAATTSVFDAFSAMIYEGDTSE